MHRILGIVAGGALAAVLGAATFSGDVNQLASEPQDREKAPPPVPPVDSSAERSAGIQAEQQPPPPPNPAAGQRDWRRDGGGFRLTPETREHVIAVIGDLRPLSAEERERLIAMSLDELRATLAEQGGMILGLARLRETQPELYELRIKDMKLLRRIQDELEKLKAARDTGQAEALAAAEEALRVSVAEQIDLRFQIREREIAALEQRVASMREELQREREQPREELIARRLEMFQTGDGREWWRDGGRGAGDRGPTPPSSGRSE